MHGAPISHRLFLPIALAAYCLGLAASRIFPSFTPGNSSSWHLVLVALLLLAYLLWREALLRSNLLPPLLFVLFFLSGLSRLCPAPCPPPTGQAYSFFKQPQTVTIVGQIELNPTRRQDKITFIASTEEIITRDGRHPAGELIRFSLPTAEMPLLPGDHFIARAKISRISSFSNPGLFNYRQYMAAKGIRLQGWISSPLHLLKLEKQTRSSFLPGLLKATQRLRSNIGAHIDIALEEPDASLFKALLIGERAGVPTEVIEHFKAGGTMHLLAISGLHLGILALFCLVTFRWLLNLSPLILQYCSAWKIASLLTLFPLTAYAVIAGWQPPVVRALIMFAVIAGASLLNRQTEIYNTVSLAALLILAVSPESLFSVSFQLSFSALLAIIVFAKRFPQAVYPSHPGIPAFIRIRRFVSASLLLSSAACIGTAPLLLHYFHRLSLLSPFSTLLLGPLLCFWALPFGLLGSLSMPVAPELATLLFKTGGYGIELGRQLNSIFAGLPISEIYFFSPSPFEILLYFGLVLGFLWHHRFRYSGRIILLLNLLLAISAGANLYKSRHGADTEVVFLDVGQGSATVVHLAGGKTILIDGGGTAWKSFDPGSNIIAPYLWNRRILRLDDIILSHAHADHYNGLFYIISHFHPRRLWVSTTKNDEENYQHLLEFARQHGTKVLVSGEMARVWGNGDGAVNVVNALELLQNMGSADFDAANTGLLTKIVSGDFSLLLPGDIGTREEKLLSAVPGPFLLADLLLAAHHGSPGSNSSIFLERVQPQHIVVSTAWQAEKTSVILSERAPFLSPEAIRVTSRDGAVHVKLSEGKATINTVGKGESQD